MIDLTISDCGRNRRPATQGSKISVWKIEPVREIGTGAQKGLFVLWPIKVEED
jgi:hypothetical protein